MYIALGYVGQASVGRFTRSSDIGRATRRRQVAVYEASEKDMQDGYFMLTMCILIGFRVVR